MKRSILVRSAKRFVVMVACAVMLFINSQPANAVGMKSAADPSDGMAKMDQVQQEAKAVSQSQPRGISKVQQKSNAGLNGVQGKANAASMNTPENSGEATTIEEQAKGLIKAATR